MPIQPGEPVYFLSLELQNIGAFGPEGVTLDLSDGQGRPAKWTLILGENGIGKTTALACLLALTPDARSTKSRKKNDVYESSDMFLKLARQGLSKGELERLKVKAVVQSSSSFIRLPGQSPRTPQEIEVRIRYSRLSVGGQGDVLMSSREHRHTTAEGGGWPGKPIYSYQATRDADFDSARFPEPQKGRRTLDPDRPLRIFTPVAVDEWLVSMHHTNLALMLEGRDSAYEQIRELLIEVLPQVRDIRALTPEKRQDTVRMEYLTDDGWVPYSNLGLGYKSVMGLIGDLAYRLYTAYPDSQEPLKEAAVVLIDEIDLHLHAKWQRDLIRVLSERFPNVQFIATAHSPLMVQAAAGHNLVLLYRDPETRKVRVANDVDDIANWRLDQIVTSELFGAPSARPPKYDDDVRRRDAILVQPDLSEEDRAEVRRIEGRLADVPLADSPKERRTEELLQRTLQLLEKKAEG